MQRAAVIVCCALAALAAAFSGAPSPALAQPTYTVVIDAGHQARANNHLERVAPGSRTKKAKVASGASGRATHNREYAINLKVALALRDRLQGLGVNVVMVRTTNSVNIPNTRRAAIANAAGADLFVRIHCDGRLNSSVHGISTLYPPARRWTKSIGAASKRAARALQASCVSATGARNRGISARTDMTAFNWCKVPTALVEMGFLSNRAEDRRLGTVAYRDKLADGLASGVMTFLAGEAR